MGLLLGLGFDTATEIGVLGISAAEASKGLSVWAILVFLVLFAAGMSRIDTTDNILMSGAYEWAFVKPIAKLNHNFDTLGYLIVGLLALSWILSIAFYKWRRFDDLELDA